MKALWEYAEDYAFAKIAGKKRTIPEGLTFKEINEKNLLDNSNIDISLKRFLKEHVISPKKVEETMLLKILIRYEVDTNKIDDTDEEIRIIEDMLNGNDEYTKIKEEKEFIKTISLLDAKKKNSLLFELTLLIEEYDEFD